MSLMPKRGVCFSCGHDHGKPGSFMPPDMERMATAHVVEMASKNERIAKLERENAELWKALQDIRNDPRFHWIKNRTHLLVCTLLDRIEKASALHQPDSGEKA